MYKFLNSKKGFTLVELIIVVVIMGILCAVAIPIYTAIQKNNRIKICRVAVDKIESDIKIWAMQEPFNQDYSFKIDSDGTITALNHGLDEEVNTAIVDEAFKGELPSCPAEGSFSVVLTQNPNKTYCSIKVTCDGGTDGDYHK